MHTNETLTRGAIVEVQSRRGGDEPGRFVGTVVAIDGNVAKIRPASADLRAFLGGDGTYVLGSAHWPARLTIRG